MNNLNSVTNNSFKNTYEVASKKYSSDYIPYNSEEDFSNKEMQERLSKSPPIIICQIGDRDNPRTHRHHYLFYPSASRLSPYSENSSISNFNIVSQSNNRGLNNNFDLEKEINKLRDENRLIKEEYQRRMNDNNMNNNYREKVPEGNINYIKNKGQYLNMVNNNNNDNNPRMNEEEKMERRPSANYNNRDQEYDRFVNNQKNLFQTDTDINNMNRNANDGNNYYLSYGGNNYNNRPNLEKFNNRNNQETGMGPGNYNNTNNPNRDFNLSGNGPNNRNNTFNQNTGYNDRNSIYSRQNNTNFENNNFSNSQGNNRGYNNRNNDNYSNNRDNNYDNYSNNRNNNTDNFSNNRNNYDNNIRKGYNDKNDIYSRQNNNINNETGFRDNNNNTYNNRGNNQGYYDRNNVNQNYGNNNYTSGDFTRNNYQNNNNNNNEDNRSSNNYMNNNRSSSYDNNNNRRTNYDNNVNNKMYSNNNQNDNYNDNNTINRNNINSGYRYDKENNFSNDRNVALDFNKNNFSLGNNMVNDNRTDNNTRKDLENEGFERVRGNSTMPIPNNLGINFSLKNSTDPLIKENINFGKIDNNFNLGNENDDNNYYSSNSGSNPNNNVINSNTNDKNTTKKKILSHPNQKEGNNDMDQNNLEDKNNDIDIDGDEEGELALADKDNINIISEQGKPFKGEHVLEIVKSGEDQTVIKGKDGKTLILTVLKNDKGEIITDELGNPLLGIDSIYYIDKNGKPITSSNKSILEGKKVVPVFVKKNNPYDLFGTTVKTFVGFNSANDLPNANKTYGSNINGDTNSQTFGYRTVGYGGAGYSEWERRTGIKKKNRFLSRGDGDAKAPIKKKRRKKSTKK